MGQPYVGEIRIFGGNFFAPPWGGHSAMARPWPIDQYSVLFTLIGTTYGGDGVNTFNLPDLRGRVPINMGQLTGGQNYVIGTTGGGETVTLTSGQIATHTHTALCATQSGNTTSPSGAIWAVSTSNEYKGAASPTGTMAGTPFTGGGQNQPHSNLQPYLALSFILSFFGIFPSQS